METGSTTHRLETLAAASYSPRRERGYHATAFAFTFRLVGRSIWGVSARCRRGLSLEDQNGVILIPGQAIEEVRLTSGTVFEKQSELVA